MKNQAEERISAVTTQGGVFIAPNEPQVTQIKTRRLLSRLADDLARNNG